MKRLGLALAIAALLLCILVVVVLVVPLAYNRLRLRQARAAAMADLPDLSEFEVVTVISDTSSMSAYGKTCYYSGGFIILGTSLPEEDALEVYVAALQSKGWALADKPQHDWSKQLIRGQNEHIGVSFGGPGWAIERDEGYQQAKDDYPTLLYVSLRYILPKWEEC